MTCRRDVLRSLYWSLYWMTLLRFPNLLSLSKAILFPLIKQVCFRASEVDYFWTSVSVFLGGGAPFAIISIRNAWPTANHTSTLVRTVVTLVTDPHQSSRPHEAIANNASTIAYKKREYRFRGDVLRLWRTFFAQPANCDSW